MIDRLGLAVGRGAANIEMLRGWRRAGAAAVLGAASILAMAPFYLWPILLVTLPALVWLIDGAVASADQPGSTGTYSSRGGAGFFAGLRDWFKSGTGGAAMVGWAFGFGYHLLGLFWIGEAFLVEAEKFAALLPLAVTLLPAGLALFFAGATALAARFWRPRIERVLLLSITIAGTEWLRGHVLTGFPWNILGYALTYPLPLMQAASVLGIYGLTLLAVGLLAVPGVALADQGRARSIGKVGTGSVGLALGAPAAAIAAMAMLGALRLWAADPSPNDDVLVRLVQPSVPQREKWRSGNQAAIFRQHLDMSAHSESGQPDGAKGIRLIVWPEAAMPFLPLSTPMALAEIGRLLPEGAFLVSGALRLEERPGGGRDVFNSLLAFGASGKLEAAYDKNHLVPFGEYLPLQATLEAIGLEQLSRLRGGFASGARPRPLLAIPGLPKLGPLICYEAIFAGAIVEGGERPAALVNVTNDGWFGNTTGPRQHLHQTRVRAVEEGLPILRAANNGISAIIDAKGRILKRIDLDAVGVIDGALPGALPATVYAVVGDSGFALLMLLAIACFACCARRNAE